MALQLAYATSANLTEILQNKVPLLTMDDELFDIMAIESVQEEMVTWEQRDNYTGLTGGRLPDDGYGRVNREGANRFSVRPGSYGDDKTMTESFLTNSRMLGSFAGALDITVQQGKDQDHLLQRAIDRIRKIGWDLFCTGTYSVTNPQGAVVATDSYPLVPFNCATPWSNFAASTPLLDLRNAKLRHRGQSATFGRKGKLFLNSQDVNSLLSNTNPNDLGAKRVITVNAGAQPMTLETVNSFLLSDNLPQIVEYDKFWIDDTQATQMFIAQGFGVLVGARDMGDPVSIFKFTRNAEILLAGSGAGIGMPGTVGNDGPFSNIFYDFELQRKPVRGISTIGFNGAPTFEFPSAIVPFRC